MFIDSSARARVVVAAAIISALGSANLLLVAGQLAGTATAAGKWVYFQWSLGFASLMMLVFTAAFLAWFYRAYSNLPALTGARSSWHRVWVFVGWVLPLVNVFLPCLLLWETGRKSAAGGIRGNWFRGLLVWWAFGLFDAGLLNTYWQQIAAVGLGAPPAVFAAALGPAVPEIVFAHLLFAIDGLLAGWLVLTVAAMQGLRRREPPPPARPEPAGNNKGYY
jgi:hypothetical protein